MLIVSCADEGDDVDKEVGPKDNERSKLTHNNYVCMEEV